MASPIRHCQALLGAILVAMAWLLASCGTPRPAPTSLDPNRRPGAPISYEYGRRPANRPVARADEDWFIGLEEDYDYLHNERDDEQPDDGPYGRERAADPYEILDPSPSGAGF